LKRVTESHSRAESSTTQAAPRLTLDALAGSTPVRRVVGRNMSKADVLVYRLGSRSLAVKDYRGRPFIARQTVGRLLVRRECRAYREAGPCPGLAPFLGRLGPFTLATEWIDATPLADLPPGGVTDAVFDRLDAVIATLHARGIAVADLHHRDVLVGADGAVHVVDLAAAYVRGAASGPWRRKIFERLRAQDRLATARMRARFTGRSEADALAGLDPRSVRLWGVGRRIKGLWDRVRGRRA
jgi:hypothetical protein